MRNAGGEKPQIAVFDVGDEAPAIRIDAGDSSLAVEHERPFRGGVPVQLADASGGQSHVDSGQALGHRKLPFGDFAGPATFVKTLVGEGKGIFERLHAARIRSDGIVRVRIRGIQSRIGGAGVAAASVGVGSVARLLLPREVPRRENRCRRDRRRARAQKSPPRQCVFFRRIGHVATPSSPRAHSLLQSL